jgi:hypothetical protein
VMGRAYAYIAEGAPPPMEMEAVRLVGKFGAQAVYGRQLGACEMRCMEIAETVINAYQQREASKAWAKWAADNPGLNRLLDEAAGYCYGG